MRTRSAGRRGRADGAVAGGGAVRSRPLRRRRRADGAVVARRSRARAASRSTPTLYERVSGWCCAATSCRPGASRQLRRVEIEPSRITAPTLVVRGALDWPDVAVAAQRFVERDARTRARSSSTAARTCRRWRRPDEVARLILDFLSERGAEAHRRLLQRDGDERSAAGTSASRRPGRAYSCSRARYVVVPPCRRGRRAATSPSPSTVTSDR